MIDTHLHVVPPRLPGVGPLNPLLEKNRLEVAGSLRQEMEEAKIQSALAMGSAGFLDEDPLGINETLAIAEDVPGLHAVGVANPLRNDPEQMRRIEKALNGGRVKALKIYLGYLHFGPDHPVYRAYYELAERHRLPVIFHTGDTFSPYAKVRLAHPLTVDDIAVDHPRVSFVLAHVGNPWMIDTAEVVYKNMNVWTDLSGLAVGFGDSFLSEERQEALVDLSQNLQKAFRYAERPNRFLFGSDWPLVGIGPYRNWLEQILPPSCHPMIFEGNARNLFKI